MEEEKTLKELIEETREYFRKERMFFHAVFPTTWKKLLEACVNDIPRVTLEKILEKSEISLAEARGEVMKIWSETIDGVFSLLKKQFQAPIKLEETETQALALINLLEEVVRFAIEELKTLDIMQEEVKKARQKRAL